MRENPLQVENPLDIIIGETPQIKKIKEIILKIADGDYPVLIEGESGTGKELVARAIHALSLRSKFPFIPINCGAIPEGIIESELFGHRKGAFTGAVYNYEGLFKAANGGTLFLDEIAEMPNYLQVKLLRVLQDLEIRALGDTKTTRVDVRIITATNSKVEESLKMGRLRYDLFYRISFVYIKLPPLRERREDIPLLVQHFIKKFNIRFKRKIKGITKDALDALFYYHWPGNVRELENFIGRAFALSSGNYITVQELPPAIWDGKATSAPEHILSVEEAERQLIKRALKEAGGNKTKAAKLLGIGRKTLYMKIKKYNLEV